MPKLPTHIGLWPCANMLALATALFLCGVIVWEWCSFQRERRATIVLERDYSATAIAGMFGSKPGWTFDLRQLKRGHLYVPVTAVVFSDVTVDRRAFDQLASFRCLNCLTLRKCQIEPATVFSLPNAGHLTDLSLLDTPITIHHLHGISQLSRLKNLTIDGTGLKGDWLQFVSRLRELQYFVLSNGRLSNGATNSLARMKGLTTLQISNVEITSALGPAIAKLHKLENLVIDNTPFDDEGMKHLAALKHLKVLFLGGTAITDSGMATLEKLPSLWRVSLDNTRVGNVGLRHLTQLPRLSGLDIRRTRATNSCLRTLAAMPSLKVALVGNTAISESLVGFIGVLSNGVWYPNEAKAKEAEDNSGPVD